MKTYITLLILALAISCTNDSNKNNSNHDIVKGAQILAKDLQVDENGLSHLTAIIKTTHGNIHFKFYPKKAPNTVTRIVQLINQGFYDGLTFHRVIPGFVIQGGDPTGTGASGSGVNLKAEFNDLKHELGIVAMARAQDPDSADSQFYIALARLPHLDGKYTIFGKVVKGLDTLKKISQGDKMLSITTQE